MGAVNALIFAAIFFFDKSQTAQAVNTDERNTDQKMLPVFAKSVFAKSVFAKSVFTNLIVSTNPCPTHMKAPPRADYDN